MLNVSLSEWGPSRTLLLNKYKPVNIQRTCRETVNSFFLCKSLLFGFVLEEQGTEVVLDFQLIQEDLMWCVYMLSDERADVFFTSMNGIDG